MLLLKKIEQLSCKTAISLGLFDGIHLGHKAVICKAVEYKNKALVPTTFTFNIDDEAFIPSKTSQRIINYNQKCDLLKKLGIEIIVAPHFSDIKELSPTEFVEDILIKKLNAFVIVCGYDYHFGKNAEGDIFCLKELCEKHDVELVVIEKMLIDDERVSSTQIKNYIKNGDIEKANKMLGYNYYIQKKVVQGIKLGRTLGFPTINQNIDEDNIVIPRNGVYYTKTTINSNTYKSITNVGVKPTIEGERKPLFETHILGFDNDLYGKEIKVEFLEFLRGEKKFDNLKSLIQAINSDKENVVQKK